MDINEEYLIVFKSHNQAAYLYNKLRNQGYRYRVKLISTPCKISKGCSQSIKVRKKYLDYIIKEIKEYKVSIRGIYKIKMKGNKKQYILCENLI
ncbi:DUF3343 domain-containing protein [Clostridium botulinum]|nr:DUF3343 domain-containing protein [Clostridium botulinum]